MYGCGWVPTDVKDRPRVGYAGAGLPVLAVFWLVCGWFLGGFGTVLAKIPTQNWPKLAKAIQETIINQNHKNI